MEIKVGTLAYISYELMSLLGEKPGVIGVCFEVYVARGIQRPHHSFIFRAGGYDGFSEDEAERMLIVIGDTNFQYEFKDVMQLRRDYGAGRFDWLRALDYVGPCGFKGAIRDFTEDILKRYELSFNPRQSDGKNG